jgi:hypothetical protein
MKERCNYRWTLARAVSAKFRIGSLIFSLYKIRDSNSSPFSFRTNVQYLSARNKINFSINGKIEISIHTKNSS